jgi:dipeptidyl aminopeptidase/acylaminoacyl peptidase
MQDHLPAAATMFAYDGDRWNALPVSRAAQRAASRDNSPRRDVPSSMSSTAPFASSPLPFKVGIRQGPNDPPRMMASRDARETVLTTGGTVPEGVKIGRAERIEWLGSDGKPDSALLMLPEDSGAAQSRLPLVIQLGEDTSRDFRPEGSAFGFFAAQSLVAKGFAVVQLHAFDDRNAVLNLHEGPRIVQRVDALVAMLEGRGWVDAKRVGLVGFSRSGYHVYYVITHPARTRIAAAAVFDSITASYGEYVISAAAYADGSASVYEKQYGTGTFWQNKTEWMDAPAFNLERSMTPVLFSATSEQYPLGALETLGAFRITERPIEYLYFPNAAHELQSPAQRELAQRTSIDWLSFWMQGRENMEAPMEQRVRWRNMRERWNRKLAEAAP